MQERELCGIDGEDMLTALTALLRPSPFAMESLHRKGQDHPLGKNLLQTKSATQDSAHISHATSEFIPRAEGSVK